MIGFGYFQTGLAIFGSNIVASVFKAKFGWNSDQAHALNTLISALTIAAILVGTLTGNMFAKYERRALLIFNLLALVATSLTMVLNLPLIILGRCLFGFSCGILVVVG